MPPELIVNVVQLVPSSLYAAVVVLSVTAINLVVSKKVEPSSIEPYAKRLQPVPPLAGIVIDDQVTPSILVLAVVPAPIATKSPVRAIPAVSNTTTPPLSSTVVNVSVMSLSGLAPPTDVPGIVNSSSLVYPAPANTTVT